jgi:hypothetical protein
MVSELGVSELPPLDVAEASSICCNCARRLRISLLSDGVVLPVIPPLEGAELEQASNDEDESVDDAPVDEELVEELGSICDIREASIWLA